MLQLQRAAGNQAMDRLLHGDQPSTITARDRSSGMPLDPVTRLLMEAGLGIDLGGVRVHTGQAAARSARQVDAQAFTVGADIVLGTDAPPLQTGQGQRLLAHELVHVVQQRDQRRPRTSLAVSRPGDDAEREADRMAAVVAVGGVVAPLGRGSAKLYRQQRPPAPAPHGPGRAANLQQKYVITVSSGDKSWSADDLKALEWTLSRLTKREARALKGYAFLRWSDPAGRQAMDPTYQPSAEKECGLHQADIATSTYKISMYDKCFKDPEATSETMADVPIERFHMLHEIGHAMEIAELRQAYEAYSLASDVFNAAVEEHNQQNAEGASTARLRRLEKKASDLEKKLDAAEKRYEAAKIRTITDFEKRVTGAEPLTEYSKTSAQEAFAEAFALYKADPNGLQKSNRSLYDWFSGHGHLNPLTSIPRSKAKPR